MHTSPPLSRCLHGFTNTLFEILVAALTLLPFLVSAYFYSDISRVPLFLNLAGEVTEWGKKSLWSVFRVPMMAFIIQVICLLMKYGTVQSATAPATDPNTERVQLEDQYLRVQVSLWDWFRFAAATKMFAEFLDTLFLSIERFQIIHRRAFVVSVVVTLLGAAGALYYLYRLLAVRRVIKEKFGDERPWKPIDTRHLYGGFLYYNTSDSALFVSKYIFNFANKWVWILIASIIAYPLLVFWPY